jgi:hypothetical protein
MVSNTAGERYSFTICLPGDFDARNYTLTRNGDTILVNFPQVKPGQATAMYKLTLDVDAKPRYNFIQLGGKLIAVVPGNY